MQVSFGLAPTSLAGRTTFRVLIGRSNGDVDLAGAVLAGAGLAVVVFAHAEVAPGASSAPTQTIARSAFMPPSTCPTPASRGASPCPSSRISGQAEGPRGPAGRHDLAMARWIW